MMIPYITINVPDLERSQRVATDLEVRMRNQEDERRQLEEAQIRAEELRQQAEEAANLEKEERERKVRGL